MSATTSTTMSTTTTDAPARTNRPRTSSLLVALLAALAAIVGLPTLTGSASAYTTTQSSVPVAPVLYQVQGRHYDSGSAVTGPMWRPWVYQPGPVVYRARPTGTEYVRVTYTVQRWNGWSWASYFTASSNVTIGTSATSVRAGALSFLPNAGAGHYTVRVSVTHTNPIGAVIGSFSAAMNHSGDYRCSTTRSCAVGSGYVTLGS